MWQKKTRWPQITVPGVSSLSKDLQKERYKLIGKFSLKYIELFSKIYIETKQRRK
jgi:hypothetical protein